tara:strand:+ start:434 stop:562 length:129 start_codon:yes stop_codon:yes gene_type:complete
MAGEGGSVVGIGYQEGVRDALEGLPRHHRYSVKNKNLFPYIF